MLLSTSEIIELSEHIPEELELARGYKPGRWYGYICPHCGSGTGPHHTPAVSLYRDRNTGKLMWYCHNCEKGGDICNLFMYKYGDDESQALRRARQKYYNEPIRLKPQVQASSPQRIEPRREAEPPAEVLPKNYTAYLRACIKSLNTNDDLEPNEGMCYLRKLRHLSAEVIDHFWLGYDEDCFWYDNKGEYINRPAITIPYPGTHGRYYCQRFVDCKAPKYLKLKDTEEPIYNACALSDEVRPVFVVEGAFDAISIYQTRYEHGNDLPIGEQDLQAIALGGISNGHKLINYLTDHPTKARLIVAFDEEDNDQTKANQANLVQALKDMGIRALTFEGLYIGMKDANAAMCCDETAFNDKLTEAIRKAYDEYPDI